VLGDARRAERLLEHDIAALGAEGHPDGIGQDVDAVQHALTGVLGEFHFLSRHCFLLRGQAAYAAFFLAATSSSTPRMSLSFMMRSSSPSIFTSVPDHLPNSTWSPGFTSSGWRYRGW